MERNAPSSLGDFAGVLKRRKYWILIPFVIVVALGVALTPFVPRTYKSTTTIMVQPQNLPGPYVRPPSAGEMINRIHKIQLDVMSGPELVQLIRKIDLYPHLRQRAKMSTVVATMGKDISLGAAPDSSGDDGRITAFTISYIGHTPQEAQQVTNALANLFIQENLKEGHQRALGAVAFLNSQVAQAGQQLAAQQAKIQAFKNAHLGSLPEQAQVNLQLIGQYENDLQTNNAAVDQDNRQLVYLQSVLNVNPKSGPAGKAAAPPTPLQIELAQDQAQLRADLLKYTPEHPDVVRLKHDIAALKVQIHEAPKANAAPVVSEIPQATGPSETDLLRGQLVGLNTEIKQRYVHEKMIEAKLAELQGQVATVPAVQTEYTALDSQYQEMQKAYNALLEKQQEANMAAALYRSDDSEQLVVIQPANFPSVPYRPNPILLYMASVLLGLLVGCVCAGIVEMRDDTMHDADEVATYLKLPVMVALPKFVP
ncbi:MAG: Wzz/FepE/Etk N-terminal domain-containing protein [Acidobacteriaceae bacterium]